MSDEDELSDVVGDRSDRFSRLLAHHLSKEELDKDSLKFADQLAQATLQGINDNPSDQFSDGDIDQIAGSTAMIVKAASKESDIVSEILLQHPTFALSMQYMRQTLDPPVQSVFDSYIAGPIEAECDAGNILLFLNSSKYTLSNFARFFGLSLPSLLQGNEISPDHIIKKYAAARMVFPWELVDIGVHYLLGQEEESDDIDIDFEEWSESLENIPDISSIESLFDDVRIYRKFVSHVHKSDAAAKGHLSEVLDNLGILDDLKKLYSNFDHDSDVTQKHLAQIVISAFENAGISSDDKIKEKFLQDIKEYFTRQSILNSEVLKGLNDDVVGPLARSLLIEQEISSVKMFGRRFYEETGIVENLLKPVFVHGGVFDLVARLNAGLVSGGFLERLDKVKNNPLSLLIAGWYAANSKSAVLDGYFIGTRANPALSEKRSVKLMKVFGLRNHDPKFYDLVEDMVIDSDMDLDEAVECACIHLDDDYKIVRKLGEGAHGSTYLVHDTQLDKKKVMKLTDRQSEEAKIMAMLDDRELESIVRVYSASASSVQVSLSPNHDEKWRVPEREYAIFMEYIEGKDLQDVMDQAGSKEKTEDKTVLRYGSQIFKGLITLQKKGIFHRDVRPKNIRVQDDGTVKIIDFSNATTDPKAEPKYSRTYGGYTDYFSLGLILYEMCTGIHLIRERQEDEGTETHANAVAEERVLVMQDEKVTEKYRQRIRNNTSWELNDIILACMESNDPEYIKRAFIKSDRSLEYEFLSKDELRERMRSGKVNMRSGEADQCLDEIKDIIGPGEERIRPTVVRRRVRKKD